MISKREGREVFGEDPAAYDAARPQYPTRVYEILAEKRALGPGVATFEIGPGSGLATRTVLGSGNSPYVAIESDARFAHFLSERHPELTILNSTFEDASLEEAVYDFGFAATSFHWLEEDEALAKVAKLLRPGGVWAAWWHVYGDPRRDDPFREATNEVLGRLAQSPSAGSRGIPFALDVEARIAALKRHLVSAEYELISWTLTLDTAGVRALYATFSEVARLPQAERALVLEQLEAVARTRFGGAAHRNVVTAVYTASLSG